MSEHESPNYAEYVYTKKSEGRVRLYRTLMVLLYVAFISGFFIFCLVTRLIPVFAIGPLLLYILVLCTWRFVKYDCYWEFEIGMLKFGKIRVNKSGRHKKPKLSVHVKDALEICPYLNKNQLVGVKEIYDYSESQNSGERILIIFMKDGKRCAVIFEGTMKIGKLLTSFSKNAHDLKDRTFHG